MHQYKIAFLLCLLVTFLIVLFVAVSECQRCLSYAAPNTDGFSQLKEDIDFVITWVDSSDKDWQVSLKYWNVRIFGTFQDRPERYPSKTNSSRELKTAVNSVLRYLPWIRNIIIVTQRPHIPEFLTLDTEKYKKIRIVHHDEIFKRPEDLPTFNSHAIESNIHNIPELSECFIYSNDDMYIVRHMLPSDFFDSSGRPLIGGHWVPNCFLVNMVFRLENRNGAYAAWATLIESIGTNFIFLPSHTCMPLTKALTFYTERNNMASYMSTSSTKFRLQKNLQIPPISFALNFGLLSRAVLQRRDSKLLVSLNALTDQYPTACLNESSDMQKLDFLDQKFLSPNPRRTIDVGGIIVMLVARCEDQLLCGASYLLLSQNLVKIIVLTKQSSTRRREMAEVVAKINMDGGYVEIVELGVPLLQDSNISFFPSTSGQQLVTNIIERIRGCTQVAQIVSHGDRGEHVNINQRLAHDIAKDVANQLHVPIETFREAWDRTVPELDATQKSLFARQRERLFRNYETLTYGRIKSNLPV